VKKGGGEVEKRRVMGKLCSVLDFFFLLVLVHFSFHKYNSNKLTNVCSVNMK